MEKILIIDDETPTLRMLSLALGAVGYTVLTADNGMEGLAVFEKERPPLVVTDIKMPVMDGIEVLRRVKQITPRTEVIVVTGHGDMDLAIEALNLEAADFITKPIRMDALEKALRSAVERIRMTESKEKDIHLTEKETAAVIQVRGNFDSGSEALFQNAFQDALALKKKKIVIRFEQTASIHGTGIAVLTQLLLKSRKTGRPPVLVVLSDNFRKIFDIVGLPGLTEIYGSEEEALGEAKQE